MARKSLPEREEEILTFWKQNNIFEKSVAARKDGELFVFFEGPPTANGRPGIHHVLGRSFKDIILRYKTMQGFWVWRRAGWDTHGLPVELEVEKELGLNNKSEIEKYGIDKFNQRCRESVWKYKEEWEELTERMGFWIDLQDPYITYETRYIENVWNVLKRLWDKRLLFQDFKVVPYCVRCGTPISSHEVAQGYRTITDNSVYIKFKVIGKDDTYLLAWTTTPWTLPGNVALAVGKDIEYVAVEKNGEKLILARDLVQEVFGESDSVGEIIKGADLIGLEYEPLFNVPEITSYDKAHKVYAADFVSTKEGTGIVHTAVMYGVEDFELGNRLGLPKVHTVKEDSTFIDSVPVVGGRAIVKDKQKDPETENLIIEHLKKNNLLLKEEGYEHEYPYCWRCESPLLYYARESWFIGASQKRKELLKNNEQIHWVPEHIKDGRFGEWLREVKDWAISRERYWGTPLPIWECENETCENKEIMGSLQDLNEKRADEPTTFLFMRHGEAVSNVERRVSSYPELKDNPLTDKGIEGANEAADNLAKEKIDAIYASDIQRTAETAELVADRLGLTVQYREDLREIDVGPFNGHEISKYRHYLDFIEERFKEEPDKVESRSQLRSRLVGAMRDIATKNPGKKVLVVSHGGPLYAAEMVLTEQDFNMDVYKHSRLNTAEFREVVMPNWPFNNVGEVDLHRPYSDEIVVTCSKCNSTMWRVKDLVDVWLDSGSMPFAQGPAVQEYSRSRAGTKELGEPVAGQFPADYIIEGIDQTRGWFYTMHAISTLLERGPAYKNVISQELLLDKEGKKMSKSVGNVVSPQKMIEIYGVDTLRWYFYTVNSVGTPILFDEGGVKERERKFIMTLLNSMMFLETYWDKDVVGKKRKDSLLDSWMRSRLHSDALYIEKHLDEYDVVRAMRQVEVLVGDLSNWYIRRSRDRLQSPKASSEKGAAQYTLYNALYTIVHLIAPATPFLSEALFQRLQKLYVSSDKESIHLHRWASGEHSGVDKGLEQNMEKVRALASEALAERARVGIKVRQKLGTLRVSKKDKDKVEELEQILKDEVNVGVIKYSDKISAGGILLDTTITPELEREGVFREITRAANALRKKADLTPQDMITLVFYAKNPSGEEVRFSDLRNELASDARANKVTFGKTDDVEHKRDWEDNGWSLWVGIITP